MAGASTETLLRFCRTSLMTFRISTFNMQNGQPWCDVDPDARRIDLERTASFLQSLEADVLCLQEVEQGHDGGVQIDPPPHFGRLRELLPDYDAVFAYPAINKTEIPFGLGLAIFSRHPLTGFQPLHLPAAPLEFEFAGRLRQASPRLMIEAQTLCAGRMLPVFNTHLQAFFMIGGSSDDHPEQRRIVAERLRSVDGGAILAGDMNCAPGESLLEEFRESGLHTAQNHAVTWRRRPYVTDHIFFKGGLELIDARVVHTGCSDHHAVSADFCWC
jgi:endonuclease/exonuclease/phosphatase family metal-dependent hydrolase